MIPSRTRKAAAAPLLLLLAGCDRAPAPAAAPPAPAAPPAAAGRLVIGDVDANDPVRKCEWFRPFADHLATRLGRFGIGGAGVKIAPDMATLASWLAAGEVDLYLDSFYPALFAADTLEGFSTAYPAMREWLAH